MKLLTKIKTTEARFLLALVAVGLALQFYNFPNNTGFAADQEFFAYQARDIILNHKLTLIGIPTSVGGLFVAPLFTYWLTFWLWLTHLDPIGFIFSNLIISAFNILTTYLILSRLFSRKIGLLAGGIVAFSTKFLQYGLASAWPVTPFFGIGLLTFFLAMRENWSRQTAVLLGVLVGLGLNLHVQIILLAAPLAITAALKIKNRQVLQIDLLAAVIIVLVLTSPLFVFDFRHNHILYHDFRQLQAIHGGGLGFPQHLSQTVQIIFATQAQIFSILNWQNSLSFLSLLAVFVPIAFLAKKRHPWAGTVLWWVALGALVMSFYPAWISDQYLFVLAPLIFLIFVCALEYFSNKLSLSAIFLILLGFFILAIPTAATVNSLSLNAKKQTAQKIKKMAGETPIAISLVGDVGNLNGFYYLLDYYKVNWMPASSSSGRPVYTIVTPYAKGDKAPEILVNDIIGISPPKP